MKVRYWFKVDDYAMALNSIHTGREKVDRFCAQLESIGLNRVRYIPKDKALFADIDPKEIETIAQSLEDFLKELPDINCDRS